MRKIINTICGIIAAIAFLVMTGEAEDYTLRETVAIKGIAFAAFVCSAKAIEKNTKE